MAVHENARKFPLRNDTASTLVDSKTGKFLNHTFSSRTNKKSNTVVLYTTETRSQAMQNKMNAN